MKSRLLALAICFVLIISLIPGVMAQDISLCGDLSDENCTILITAFTNTAAAGSGEFTLNATVDIQAEDPAQAVKANLDIDGKYSGAGAISINDVIAMSTDPIPAFTKFSQNLKTFAGELNVKIIGLPDAVTSMTGGEPLVLNLLLVEGVSYVDFSKLPAVFTASPESPKSWAGLDLIDILTNLASALASSATRSSTSTTTEDLAKVQALVAKYLEYTHDGDTFIGDVDLVGLFNDTDFKTMIYMKTSFDAETAAINSLKDVTFEVVFTLADDKLSEIQLTIDVPESTATTLNAANAVSSSSHSKPPTSGNLSLNFKYSRLGEAQIISAPQDAPVITFLDLATRVNQIFTKLVQELDVTPTPSS